MNDRDRRPNSEAALDHRAAADAFVERVLARHGAVIESVFVFGSTARGEAEGLSSDVDVLVVLAKKASSSVSDSVREVAYDVMLEFGPVVEVHTLSAARFRHLRERGAPLSHRLSVRERRMADEGPSEREIADQFRQAHQALDDAEGARDADLSDAVVVNRLYYACFHAAQGALYSRGLNPGSHGGVLSLFGSEMVVEGDASRKQGRFLNRLSELRKQADYGYEEIDEDVDALLQRVRTFVSDMESLIELE